MFNKNELKYNKDGLIPAIVTDVKDGAVLMLAYMSPESLDITLEGGKACFFSRSRGKLWLKGETSGNVQHIVSITADCDRDALVVEVRKEGPACHLGTDSCFNEVIFEGEEPPAFQYQDLMEMLVGRKENPKEGSYTTYLFSKGIDKMLKKVGEETTEVIISAKDGDRANTIYEIGDLMYHVMVMMIEMGISLEDIKKEMASRHVIDKKVKQEKMVK